jgi:hypothetical protein
MGKSNGATRKPLYSEGMKIDHCQHVGIHTD